MNLLTALRASLYYLLLIMTTFMYNVISELLWFAEEIAPIKTGIEKHQVSEIGYKQYVKKYYGHAILLIYKLVGITIYLKSDNDKILMDRRLWISNHRSKLDGLLMQSLLCSSGNNTVSITKKSVEYYPLFGSFGRHADTIFIHRNRDKCEKILREKSVESFENSRSIMIFPEGSTLSPDSKSRSDKFATENNLMPTNNVLIPRTLGFDIIKTNGKFNLTGDLTIQYDNPSLLSTVEHSFLDLFHTFPREIYIDINYKNVNTDDLYELFIEKDKKISKQIEKSLYKKNNNYSIITMVFNVVIFLFFYGLFFTFWPFKYGTLMITLITSIKTILF